MGLFSIFKKKPTLEVPISNIRYWTKLELEKTRIKDTLNEHDVFVLILFTVCNAVQPQEKLNPVPLYGGDSSLYELWTFTYCLIQDWHRQNRPNRGCLESLASQSNKIFYASLQLKELPIITLNRLSAYSEYNDLCDKTELAASYLSATKNNTLPLINPDIIGDDLEANVIAKMVTNIFAATMIDNIIDILEAYYKQNN